MTDKRYQIVFEGELVPGSQPEAVAKNLAQLFRMDEGKAKGLLSGKRVVLKKEADQATAMKFRAAMKKAGAVCEMVPLDEPEVEEIEAAPPPPASEPKSDSDTGESPPPASPGAGPQASAPESPEPAQQPAPASGDAAVEGNMEMVGTIRTGGTDFSGPFDVAPTGTEIGEKRDTGPEVDPDISHLSMAPPGTELEEIPRQQAVEVPDLSHLSLEDLPAEGKERDPGS